MNKQKIKIGKFKTVFKGKLYEVRQAPVSLNDQKGKFEMVVRRPTVVVIAQDNQKRLLFNREYRLKDRKRVWRFPGGTIEKGETSRMAAQRELQEETGFKTKELSLFHTSSLGQTIHWPRYIFLGRDLIPSKLKGDPGEDIETVFLTLPQAIALVKRGKIDHDLTEFLILKLFLKQKQGY